MKITTKIVRRVRARFPRAGAAQRARIVRWAIEAHRASLRRVVLAGLEAWALCDWEPDDFREVQP